VAGVAIDRFTGQVLDKQIEVVNEWTVSRGKIRLRAAALARRSPIIDRLPSGRLRRDRSGD
jgi:hypothetical protein